MIAAFVSIALTLRPQEQPLISTPDALRVGHVVEFRGALDEQGRFVAQKAELKPPASDDVLLGTIPAGETDPMRFTLLGQLVETDEETKWEDLVRGNPAGKRVKVEGSWKGPRKFQADSITPRGEGRDRIAARIDELKRVAGGWEVRLMIFTVRIADGTEVEHERPVAEYGLAPERKIALPARDEAKIERDEDDSFGKGIELSGTLRLLGQTELKSEYEDNFDLNDRSSPSDKFEENRLDTDRTARLRFAWAPSEILAGVVELRYNHQYRRDDDDGRNDTEIAHDAGLGETWLQWRNLGGNQGFDLTIGRQDFDDPREWIYDQNLDALRASWIKPDFRFDLSLSTTLLDGGEREMESWNAIAYVSNNDDDKNLAAWTLLRDTDEIPVVVRDPNSGNDVVVELAETSLHTGLRMLGEWIPQTECWAELAFLVAERDAPVFQGTSTTVENFDVASWAYDIGATWEPSFMPFYFTAGYALGRGDSNVAESYRQTGYQDNNARFGGVTSFSYYGELFEPELSNMGISTLGLGALLAEKISLDLVFHTYTQDVASDLFSPRPGIEANIDQQPNKGLAREDFEAELGWELDVILGCRRLENWDIEIVEGVFEPGDAFVDDDTAYFTKFQLRYRF